MLNGWRYWASCDLAITDGRGKCFFSSALSSEHLQEEGKAGWGELLEIAAGNSGRWECKMLVVAFWRIVYLHWVCQGNWLWQAGESITIYRGDRSGDRRVDKGAISELISVEGPAVEEDRGQGQGTAHI